MEGVALSALGAEAAARDPRLSNGALNRIDARAGNRAKEERAEVGTIRCLYISQTGMTEPLGQSQVLAYLRGLARRGIAIELLSMEPAGTPPKDVARIEEQTRAAGIAWQPLVRGSSPRLSRKLYESAVGVSHGLVAALRRRPHIVHARSYVATAVADVVATLTPGAKLLFDCRGMLGDEYVDSGYWTEDRLEYKLLKRFEQRVFRRADGVVVLTESLRRWLDARNVIPTRTPREVIPCCVDTNRFRFDEAARAARRRELGAGDRPVIVYSGGLGGWYLEEEMARFAGQVKRLRPDAIFLVMTRSSPDRLRAVAREQGFGDADLVIKNVPPHEMPSWLCAGDVGLCFIRPCFSKIGSSPTKIAEYLASGLIVVANRDVGDQSELAEDSRACVVLGGFGDAELAEGAKRALALSARPIAERAAEGLRVAEARFGLEKVGVDRYERLYRSLRDA